MTNPSCLIEFSSCNPALLAPTRLGGTPIEAAITAPPEPSPETTVRPNLHNNNEVSFLWTPGERLVELLYIPGEGLGFVFRDRTGSAYGSTYEQYRPLPWMAQYARINALRLPSRLTAYKSLDDLASAIQAFIHQYFDCDPLFESVATLYALHTWVYEKFHAVPYLRFLGIHGSGKTRGTDVIGAVCYRPLAIAGAMTPAALFRLIEATGGTMLLDEADFKDSQVGTDIAKLLNCGYQKGLAVTRMMQNDKGQYVPTLHEVFGPKIINGRRPFQDDATESRCISYIARPAERDVPTQLPPCFEDQARCIRNMALKWRLEVLESFQVHDIPLSGLRPRTNQILMPLLLVAEQLSPGACARYTNDLLEYAMVREQQDQEERKDTVEAKLVKAYVGWPSNSPSPTVGALVDKVLADDAGNDPRLPTWLSPKRAGTILSSLGFQTRHTNRGSEATIEGKRLAALCKRYGIGTEPSPRSSPER